MALLAMLGLAILGVSLVSVRQPVPGIYTLLAGRCAIDVFSPKVQSQWTIAIACKGVDYIRVWPLPVVKPWFEDGEYWDVEVVEMAEVLKMTGHK